VDTQLDKRTDVNSELQEEIQLSYNMNGNLLPSFHAAGVWLVRREGELCNQWHSRPQQINGTIFHTCECEVDGVVGGATSRQERHPVTPACCNSWSSWQWRFCCNLAQLLPPNPQPAQQPVSTIGTTKPTPSSATKLYLVDWVSAAVQWWEFKGWDATPVEQKLEKNHGSNSKCACQGCARRVAARCESCETRDIRL